MLQSIREHTQGWIAGAIISIIILTFALWGIHSYFVGGASRVVASVNGVEISKEQLTSAFERMRRQVQQQGSVAARDDVAIKEKALQSLIDVEVLKQASLAQGFLVSNQQVDAYLQSMPEFQVDGQFSVERFQEVISSTLMTTGEFIETLRTGLLIDQPRLGVMFTSFALPDEAKETVALVNQERDIEFITIPRAAFFNDVNNIDESQIEAYYNQHRDEFMTPEQVSVDYIELTIKDLYAKINPADTVLKSFYSENVNSYTRPMAWKLTAILVPVQPSSTVNEIKAADAKAHELYEQINKSNDFASVAAKHPGKKIGNGEFVTLSQLPSDLQKAVIGLQKTGDVSEPIKTSDGYTILKAKEVRQPQIETFDAVKNKVKQAYLRQHAEEKFAEMREKLADLTYEHPESLQFAAKTLALPVKASEVFTKEKTGTGIAQYKKVRDIAFSGDVLELENNSDVIQLSPEIVIVIRVKSHTPSALLPLKNIANEIRDKLRYQDAETKADAFATSLVNNMQSGNTNLAELASKNLHWVKEGYLGRYSTKVDTAILDLAFRLPDPQGVNKKEVYAVTKIPNGYAIVAIKGVRNGTADNKQLQVFDEQYQNSEGLLEYELYKQSQIDTAKIKNLL